MLIDFYSCYFFRYSAKPFTSTGFGIGHEKWNAVNLMMCSASVCDFAIAVVDPSKTSVGNTDAYSTFRFHMQNLYPSVQLIKIQQANLRLENDELDLITQKLFTKSGTTKVLTEREAIHLSRGGITSEFLKLDSISIAFEGSLNPSYLNCGLHSSIIFANDLRVVEWNMTSLVKVLQLIFPQSKLSTSALSDTWCVPSNQGKSGFARAVQLAKAKVYYTRESNEGKKLFDTILSEVSANHKKQISFLRKGIKGIYGVCEVHAGLSLNGKNDTAVSTKTNTHLFLVEACSAYVIVRPYLFDEKIIHKRLANESKLTVEGIFSDSDENFLKDLFRYCAQHKLAKKRLLTPLDLTTTEREKIQFLKQFRERELPSGWWFDGQSFVDINGTRLSIRPDINDIMNEYLVEENKRIRAFNDLLHNF